MQTTAGSGIGLWLGGGLSAQGGVTVRVNLPLKVSTAKALYAGKDLPVHRTSAGGVEFLVPHVNIHEVVCVDLS